MRSVYATKVVVPFSATTTFRSGWRSKTPPKISGEDFTKLANELAAILGRYHPQVQGAAISAMLANWLGRVQPDQREQAFQRLLKSVSASIEDMKALGKEHANTSRKSH